MTSKKGLLEDHADSPAEGLAETEQALFLRMNERRREQGARAMAYDVILEPLRTLRFSEPAQAEYRWREALAAWAAMHHYPEVALQSEIRNTILCCWLHQGASEAFAPALDAWSRAVVGGNMPVAARTATAAYEVAASSGRLCALLPYAYNAAQLAAALAQGHRDSAGRPIQTEVSLPPAMTAPNIPAAQAALALAVEAVRTARAASSLALEALPVTVYGAHVVMDYMLEVCQVHPGLSDTPEHRALMDQAAALRVALQVEFYEANAKRNNKVTGLGINLDPLRSFEEAMLDLAAGYPLRVLTQTLQEATQAKQEAIDKARGLSKAAAKYDAVVVGVKDEEGLRKLAVATTMLAGTSSYMARGSRHRGADEPSAQGLLAAGKAALKGALRVQGLSPSLLASKAGSQYCKSLISIAETLEREAAHTPPGDRGEVKKIAASLRSLVKKHSSKSLREELELDLIRSQHGVPAPDAQAANAALRIAVQRGEEGVWWIRAAIASAVSRAASPDVAAMAPAVTARCLELVADGIRVMMRSSDPAARREAAILAALAGEAAQACQTSPASPDDRSALSDLRHQLRQLAAEAGEEAK